MARSTRTLLVGLAVVGAGILLAALRVNPYVYFAGYVILQYVVMATAWNILGGIRPSGPPCGSYVTFLCAVMVLLSVTAVTVARFIERSWVGRGLAALRDNEEAAECMGVPTLRLKLFATTVSGVLLGVAGAP